MSPRRSALRYRVEPRPGVLRIHVQSTVMPEWPSSLPDGVTPGPMHPNPSWKPRTRARLPLTNPEAIAAWWTRQGVQHGFLPSETTIRGLGTRVGAPSLAFTVTRLEGTLTVSDPERFAELCLRGAGPGKAYGCGWVRLLDEAQMARSAS